MPLAKDSTVLEAGIGARLSERVLLEIGYSGQWSDEVRDDVANARLSVQFRSTALSAGATGRLKRERTVQRPLFPFKWSLNGFRPMIFFSVLRIQQVASPGIGLLLLATRLRPLRLAP